MESSHDTTHPSFLELDRFAVGAARSAATQAHVEQCEACRRHIELAQAAVPTPSWVRQLKTRRSPARAPFMWMGLGMSLMGAAAVVFLWLQPTEPTGEEQVAAKGAPAVMVHLKDEMGVTSVWDGASTISAGDRLQVEVAPSGYSFVTIFALPAADSTAAQATLLFAGAVAPQGSTRLPQAWQVDAEGTAEVLVIAFADARVDADRALAVAAAAALSAAGVASTPGTATSAAPVWARRFVLPKQPGRDP